MDYPISEMVQLNHILKICINWQKYRKNCPQVLKDIYDLIPDPLNIYEYQQYIESQVNLYYNK